MQMRSFANKAIGVVLLLIVIGLIVACEHEQQVTGPALAPTLSSIQANILTPKCVNAGCHPGGGAPMSLQNDQSFGALVGKNSAYGRLRVAPGNANNSVLFLKVTGAAGVGSQMPLGLPPLSNDETNAIRDWINAGALNN
jgi:hypothetical protein